MRIAVTGASGQVGSRLLAHLSKSHEVQGYDLRPGPQTAVLDIASPEAVPTLRSFEVIYHLAAAISVPESVENPLLYVRANVVGTVNVLDAARRGNGRVVFISTAAVYGEPQGSPIPETHPRNPTSPYGQSKATGEDFARLFHQLYGLNVSIVRPFNIYSEDLKPDNPYAGVLAIFLRNAREGRSLEVHGDGGQTRDFVHVSDVIQLLSLLASVKGDGEAYNCGTGVVTSILDLAEMVRQRFGPGVRIVHGAPRAGDIRHGIADISKARSLGYQPQIRLADWIQATPTTSSA
ncbi:MAG: NAD-dependent epimerase/dehydratase family protein [Thermoplasmata archaeon]